MQFEQDPFVDGTVKGFPSSLPATRMSAIGALGLKPLSGDTPLPVALLHADAIARNRAVMREYLARTGAKIAPHGKTTMSPELFALQAQDGAWGMSCATPGHLAIYRAAGIKRILYANQIMGHESIHCLLAQLASDADLRILVTVDSAEGVEALALAAAAVSLTRPVELLVEAGVAGGRTGARTLDQARLVIAAIERAHPAVTLAGVTGYEAAVPAPDAQVREENAHSLLSLLADLLPVAIASPATQRMHPFVVSAGGSALYDMVVDRLSAVLPEAAELILRSGCYLIHDHICYEKEAEARAGRGAEAGGYAPALEIWAAIQSMPEPGVAFATAGKRDLSYDFDLPVPVKWSRDGAAPRQLDGHLVTQLWDQHARIALPANSPLQVGDLVGFGVSHPCTTFDKWRLLYVIDDDYRVTSAIRTLF